MKKYMAVILMALLWIVPGCDDSDSDDSDNPTATLTITVDYLGDYGVDNDSSRPGGMLNYVHLYTDETMNERASLMTLYNEYQMDGDAIATTITGITPGEYFIVAFYDYRGSGGSATDYFNRNDRYAIYNGSTGNPLIANAIRYSLTSGVEHNLSLSIPTDWILADESYFMTTMP